MPGSPWEDLPPDVPTTAAGVPYALPALSPGDRVRILRLPTGTRLVPPRLGTVTRTEKLTGTGRPRYLVTGDDGSAGWYRAEDIEPAPDAAPAPTLGGLLAGDKVRVGPGHSGALHTGAEGVIRAIRPPTSSGTIPVTIRLTDNCTCGCVKSVGEELLVQYDRLELLEDPPARADKRLLVIGIPLTDDPEEDPSTVTELIDHIAEHHDQITFSPPEGPTHHG